MKTRLLLPLVAIILAFTTGCASTKSTKAKPLEAVYGSGVNLARYDRAVVQPFAFADKDPKHIDAGQVLANRIAQRLQNDFGPIFNQVKLGEPTGAPGELLIGGRVTEFKPGSRAGRFFGPGITPARFKAELTLKDSATGEPVFIAPIDKLWAWGGGIGASKGIEEMVDEASAAAANTIARARGWAPPTTDTR